MNIEYNYSTNFFSTVYGTMTQVLNEVGYGNLSQDTKRGYYDYIATSSMSDILDSYYDYRKSQSWN